MYYTKATTFDEIDNAVRFTVPVSPDHEFFTEFSDVRGDFEERMLYRSLNVDTKTFVYNWEENLTNKTLLFLAGMRGSGKTSELSKIAEKLHNPAGYFCVTCNLDNGLDIEDLEYMDILIFQLERLVEDLKANKVVLPNGIIESLQDWYSDRIEEVNQTIKREGGIGIEVEAKTPSLLTFLGISAKIKSNLAGSKENAEIIRRVFKHNFTFFAAKFNEFVETASKVLRGRKMAKEILFIVDGLEKVGNTEIRKRIIKDETSKIRQIKVNTIFTLPIELFYLKTRLRQFSTVISFPFVKIKNKDNTPVTKAVKRFEEFIYRRIEPSLFDSPATVQRAIEFGGGSPRELLRLLEYTYLYADEQAEKLTSTALDQAIKKLAAEYSEFLSEKDLILLKKLNNNNEAGIPTSFDEEWQKLLEDLIVLEYNDGTYKRANPLVAASELYKYYVQ